MIKAGIVGGAGYTAGELIRILLNHPEVQIEFIHSQSNANNSVTEVHQDLIGETDLKFTDRLKDQIDVLYLCLDHGNSSVFLHENKIPAHIKIIDLSQDYRIHTEGNDFVYGLPELNKSKIREADHIANPGCFATAIQLTVLPLAANKILKDHIHVNAITGSTGAGQSPSATTHFSWRNNNVSVYKTFTHQHLREIGQSILQCQPEFNKSVYFVPVRGNFTRGILATAYTTCDLNINEVKDLYDSFYKDHPFTIITETNPSLKQVVNTNKCLLYLEKHKDVLLIVGMIDNLVKGASGQAVQNMNLAFGLPENEGLKLKPVAF